MKRASFTLSRLGSRIGSVVAAIALGSCLFAAPALADDALTDNTSADASIPELLQSGLHTDYTESESSGLSTLSTESDYPEALDLRYYGGTFTYDSTLGRSVFSGGWSYVTPIKKQNPFGSCWAFSIIASAETSMLSALDLADDGQMNGSTNYSNASSGEKGDLAYAVSNLSERHLAYFAFSDTTTAEFSDQAGEGKYLVSGSTDGASIINVGGMPFMGITVFASGIGPVPEYNAPYISDENTVQSYYINETTNSFEVKTFTSKVSSMIAYAQCKAWVKDYWTDEMLANGWELMKALGNNITLAQFTSVVQPALSSEGTWSLSDSLTYGTVAELCNSNIIASTKETDTTAKNYGALTTEEINLMKQELSEGHPLSIAFVADQSKPGQTLTGNTYLNTETWAQYTYETKQVNHGVTIVGWDDNYSAENFKHTIYKKDENGNLVEDTEATALTQPAGNGAWIVKNSWGSSNNENGLYQNNWGVQDADGNYTGYFYLSYYDKNISNIESYEFDLSAVAQERESYGLSQYDLAENASMLSNSFDTEVKTVNVFGDDETETTAEERAQVACIRDLGCLTGAPNDTVTIEVYTMSSSADVTAIIDKHDPAASITKTFENAGFHRFHLDNPVVAGVGQKVAVVQITQRADGKYERTVTYGTNQTFADAFNECYTTLNQTPMSSYTKTVVNTGESYIYEDGKWTDWSVGMKTLDAESTQENIAYVKQQAASVRKSADTFRGMAEYYESYAESCGKQAEAAEEGSAEQKELLEKAVYFATAAQEYREMVDAYTTAAEKMENFSVNSSIDFDNWTIKMYSDTALKGDVTSNGVLNIVDAQAAYDIATKVYTEDNCSNYWTMTAMADVTGPDGVADGWVNALDARAIQVAAICGWN